MKIENFNQWHESAKEFVATHYDNEAAKRPEIVFSVLNAMLTHAVAVNTEQAEEFQLNEIAPPYRKRK
jgi:hypothetical protein